jgi:hypothetical protein
MHTNKSFAFLLGWYKSVEKKQIGCSDYKIAQKNQISRDLQMQIIFNGNEQCWYIMILLNLSSNL